jgi:hypothetical protein
MASNVLYYSSLNPLPLYEVNKVQQAQYMSRYSDDYRFGDSLSSFMTPVDYYQKWTTSDAIVFQFTSNFSTIQVQLMDCNDNPVIIQSAIQKGANKFEPGFYLYEDTLSLAGVTPGFYYVLVTLGGTKQLYSEPLQIFSYLPDSLLFEYSHTLYHGDIIFKTGIMLRFRVEGILKEDAPSSQTTAFIDQQYNPSILTSIPFQTATLVAGHTLGVPTWVAKKINWILSCDNVAIDGKPWARPESEKITEVSLDNQYPLKAYSVRLQEQLNRASKVIGVDVDPNKRLLIAMSVDSTIFGDMVAQAGNNIITVTSLD